MQSKIYKTFHFNLADAGIETKGTQEFGIFKGSMATEHLDRGNDIIAAKAFDASLARYKEGSRRVRLYYQHNPSNVPIGGINPANIVKNGKKWDITGELDFGVQQAREVYSALKNKNLSDLSIGFSIIDADYNDNVRTIKELELWEVSVVGEPMNPKADIVDVKANDDKKEPVLTVDEIPKHQSGNPDGYFHKNIEKNMFIEYNNIYDKIHTKRDVERLLRDSGVFSKKAAVYLSSLFGIEQRDSVGISTKEYQETDSKLDELLNVISNFKEVKL